MDEIADVIIRPPRNIYKIADLGPKSIDIDGVFASRTDFQVKNRRWQKLKCSYYCKEGIKSNNTLIYLHCNSGCRIQGLKYLRQVLSNRFNYLIFDFSGSGLSQGQFVSLDLQTVINYIKGNINKEAKIYLWGRSMGAATAIRYLSRNKDTVSAAIFDSPFESLKKLFLQIGKQKTKLPEMLLSVAYNYVKPLVLQKANFDIDEVDLLALMSSITCPGIFIASKKDQLVPFQQIDSLFNKYKGEKEMFFIEESHNEARNNSVIEMVFKALRKYVLLGQQSELKKQKSSFYSFLPCKDKSRRKLELTIKTLSQGQFKNKQSLQLVTYHNNLTQYPINSRRDKNVSACLQRYQEPIILTKRKNMPKHFISQCIADKHAQQNIEKASIYRQSKGFPSKIGRKEQESKERKTFQHISHKKPPFIELRSLKQMRNSFQPKYHT